MDTATSILDQIEFARHELTPVQASNVYAGAMYVRVTVDGTHTAVVDWDRLQWDILTGRIGVTYK